MACIFYNMPYVFLLPLLDLRPIIFLRQFAFYSPRFESLLYLHSHMICQIYGNSIAYHLVAVINIVIYEYKIIGECLHTCNFSDGHSAIEVFLSLHKFLQILFNFYHFGCLRMQLTLSSARLHGKPRLIPSSYAIARHKDRRITANEVLVIGNFAFETIGMVFVFGRNCRIL